MLFAHAGRARAWRSADIIDMVHFAAMFKSDFDALHGLALVRDSRPPGDAHAGAASSGVMCSLVERRGIGAESEENAHHLGVGSLGGEKKGSGSDCASVCRGCPSSGSLDSRR